MGVRLLFSACKDSPAACLPELIRHLGYDLAGDPFTYSSFEDYQQATQELCCRPPSRPNDGIWYLGVGEQNGWTVIFNEEITFRFFDDEIQDSFAGESSLTWSDVAQALNVRIYCAYANSTTCSYSFRLYDPTFTRHVEIEPESAAETGPAIPGEPALEVENYNEESIEMVCSLLGLNPETLDANPPYYLFPLHKPKQPAAVPTREPSAKARAWWKIW